MPNCYKHTIIYYVDVLPHSLCVAFGGACEIDCISGRRAPSQSGFGSKVGRYGDGVRKVAHVPTHPVARSSIPRHRGVQNLLYLGIVMNVLAGHVLQLLLHSPEFPAKLYKQYY